MTKIKKRSKTRPSCQCSGSCQRQGEVRQPLDYVQDGIGYDHIRHFMKPEYLNERHNTSGEGIVDPIVDPIVDAAVDDPALKECLKAARHVIARGIDPVQTQQYANV